MMKRKDCIGIFCLQFEGYDFQEVDNLERCGGPNGRLEIVFYSTDFSTLKEQQQQQ